MSGSSCLFRWRIWTSELDFWGVKLFISLVRSVGFLCGSSFAVVLLRGSCRGGGGNKRLNCFGDEIFQGFWILWEVVSLFGYGLLDLRHGFRGFGFFNVSGHGCHSRRSGDSSFVVRTGGCFQVVENGMRNE